MRKFVTLLLGAFVRAGAFVMNLSAERLREQCGRLLPGRVRSPWALPILWWSAAFYRVVFHSSAIEGEANLMHASVSGICRPRLAARSCPTHDPSVTPLMCWSKGAALSGCISHRSSHTLVPKTSMRSRWVVMWSRSCGVEQALWNSQRTDHDNVGRVGARSGHMYLRVAILIRGNSVPYFRPPAHPAEVVK